MIKGQPKLAPIGGLIEKVESWNPVRDAPEDELDYIDLSAVDNATKTVTGIQTLQGQDAPSRARQLVKSGDILVSTVRPNLNGVARVPEKADGATASTGFCVLRPKPTKLDGSYLFHWVRSSEFVADMVRKATGASYPAVSDKIIGQSEIPLPPLDEQKRIAAILDQADELRRKRQRALDLLNQLGQAIFIEMFGDPTKHEFEIEHLIADGSITVHKDGNHGSNYPRKEEFGEHGVPFLSATAIDENGQLIPGQVQYLNESKARTLKIGWIEQGDVLLSHNASVGKVALYKGEFGSALIGTSLTCFRANPQEFTPEFLSMALQSARFQNQLTANMSQTTRNQVPITAQRKLKIVRPPLDQQKRVSEVLENVAAERESCWISFQHHNRLFASLQHRAFRGEL